MFEKTRGREFKTPKSAETFERVLGAALELFQEQGFEATTMRQIAARGRLGLGALYYYFSSKDEIVLAFYQRLNVEIAASRPETTGDLAQRFTAFMAYKLDALTPYRTLFRTILKSSIDPDHPLSPFSPDTNRTREISVGVFTELTDGNEALARTLWTVHMGILFFWVLDRSANQTRTRTLTATVLPLALATLLDQEEE